MDLTHSVRLLGIEPTPELSSEDLQEGAAEDVALWSALPHPRRTAFEPHELRRSQGPSTGLNAVLGRWPGKESEDEVLAALAEIS